MEPFSIEKIQHALAGVSFVRQAVYLPVTGSTNDVARALACDGAPEATLVVADEQRAGRGRMGRAWWAPPATCLLASLLVRPAFPPRQAPRLTMVAGLAAAEAIEHIAPVQARLKWPNDIWLYGKKAGGILTETALSGEWLEYAVVGIGLNVNVNLNERPELEGSATSLMMEAGCRVDRLSLLRALVERFAEWYANASSPRLKEAWAARLVTLGQHVSVQAGAHHFEGLAEGIDDEGALLVRAADGILHAAHAGDVTLRAPRAV